MPSFSGTIALALKSGNIEKANEELTKYKKWFGDDFYLELTHHPEIEGHEENMKKLVEAAGSNMDCLLKVNVWLKDQTQQEAFDGVYKTYFSSKEAMPARTRLQVGRLPLDCGVEVEAVGYVP